MVCKTTLSFIWIEYSASFLKWKWRDRRNSETYSSLIISSIFDFILPHISPVFTEHKHEHEHAHDHKKEEDIPAWKKKALESGSDDPMAAPFGGSWNMEASVDATKDK
jgi:hypothetical protein